MLLCTSPLAHAQRAGYRETVLKIQGQIESSDLRGAQASLDSAMKLYPNDGGLENLLGVVAIQSGHRDAAKKAFSLAVLHDPKLMGAWQNLARIDMETADHDPKSADDAFRAYTRALALDPSDPESAYGAAMAALWRKQYAVSLSYLQKLDAETRAKARVQAVMCADAFGLNHGSAGEHAAAALAASSDLLESDVMLALPALRAAHRADLLEVLFSAANLHQPLSAQGLRMLGLAQEAEGKRQQAKETLEKAYEAEPTATAPLVDLARIALAGNDQQGALGYLAHARAIAPNDASLAYEYGFVCLQMKLLREAQVAIADAVRLAPENPDYLLTMGTVANGSDALRYLDKYRAMRPDDPAGFLASGIACLDISHLDDAVAWLSKAAANEKTAASAHFYLGRALKEQGKFQAALAELRQADRLHPDRPEVLAEMGEIYFSMKQYSDAIGPLKRALELDPENYVASYALLRLYGQTNDPQRAEQAKRFAALRTQREDQYRDAMRVIEARPRSVTDSAP
ncbi:tetratricopeptide repeat protein [Silvibacterium acidisoli]|uniref:tetratricopeptide repeat protein n=1 Tax=Acidobacteriaceae bacterium ZG23-2 TaxID=2883246 RepID=UPI00406C4224